MKKLIGVILALCGLWACNYDETCPVPNTEQPGGAGGGPVLPPGDGGFGDTPSPEPQNESSLWLCTGEVDGCTFGGGPKGWSLGCELDTGIGEEQADAIANLIAKCTTKLRATYGFYWSCSDIENLDCVERIPEDWLCSGVTSCKAGDHCVHEDDEWLYECSYDKAKARGRTAEIARSDLLEACEEKLKAEHGADIFCMPGSLKCTRP